MERILIPTLGPCNWRGLLKDPVTQWKRTRSALETAVSWEEAERRRGSRGLPISIASALDRTDELRDCELLVAMPEHRVQLDTAKAPSQCDVWALLRSQRGYVSLGVEAKAGEPFDETVHKWLSDDGPHEGRLKRLKWLCAELGTDASLAVCGPLRYQLFHRTVAVLLEAKRWGAFVAVMVVQAFPGACSSLEDFRRFGKYLGADVEMDQLVSVPSHVEPRLYIGWISNPGASDTDIAKALV